MISGKCLDCLIDCEVQEDGQRVLVEEVHQISNTAFSLPIVPEEEGVEFAFGLRE